MIRAGSLRGFAALVEELGGDPAVLLRRFKISAETLGSEDGLVSITSHDLMLDATAIELNCPDLGLQLAQRQDLSILGPLAIAIESSATVADAVECASRFMFVHSPALQVGVVPDPRGARGVIALTYRKDLVESPYSPQAMELGIGLFYRIAVLLLGSQAGLRSVEFPHAPISPLRRYLDFFGCDVKFGAPQAVLRVQRSILDQQFASADEAIRHLAIDYLARQFPTIGDEVAPRVRRAIAEVLDTGVPALAQVARLMSLHPRTLQRRLRAEGTSFEAVLDQVRQDAAYRYITTTDLPLGQVTALTGFAEQASLSHAVRRWFALSPRELRERDRR